MAGKAETLFRSKAPGIMFLLMRDFAWSLDDAAACLGNLGHESAGFSLLQEQKPTVAGSKGGYGWPQWTGPRRRSFEAYCARNKLDPAGDRANYGFLFTELKGAYKSTVNKVRMAPTLAAKVKTFELQYEGAGIKHYDSRNQWAAIALDAWNKAPARGVPAWVDEKPAVAPPLPTKPAKDATVTVTDGPGKTETTVVVVPNPQTEPSSPTSVAPPSRTGAITIGSFIAAILAMLARWHWGT